MNTLIERKDNFMNRTLWNERQLESISMVNTRETNTFNQQNALTITGCVLNSLSLSLLLLLQSGRLYCWFSSSGDGPLLRVTHVRGSLTLSLLKSPIGARRSSVRGDGFFPFSSLFLSHLFQTKEGSSSYNSVFVNSSQWQ